MSESLLDRECAKYEAMWAMPGYATYSPGEQMIPILLDMIPPSARGPVLDAGCGSGKGALALQAAGFEDVRLCDLTDTGLVDAARGFPFDRACLWQPLRPQLRYLPGGAVDWVYCCDVLEHIPEAFTMLVVSRLLEVARRGVFLSISTVPDSHGVWIGERLHHTVQPFVWWRDQLRELGTVLEARDLLMAGAFLVAPC